MVHEPSFLTLAGQEVRRLKSKSVAVIESLSPAATNRMWKRVGMVVLLSTTPCVAVSFFTRSSFLIVISIVAPASAPAEEGIVDGPLEDTVSTYIKTTSLK